MTRNKSSHSDRKIDISNLKAIIFDFDGTLVDSEPVWKSTFFDLFKEEYGIEVPKKTLWENTGSGVDFSVKNISKEFDLEMDEVEIAQVAKKLHIEMQKKILEELPLRNGVSEFFERDLIETYFNHLGLLGIFSVIVSTSNSAADKRKPSPFPYLETLRLLGVDATESIVIEDSPKGVTSSVAAGIATVAIHNPFLEDDVLKVKPKFVVPDFFQILELFLTE